MLRQIRADAAADIVNVRVCITQVLCQEWDAKPESEKKFEPFYNAVKAVVFSSGIKLKTRVQILTMVKRTFVYGNQLNCKTMNYQHNYYGQVVDLSTLMHVADAAAGTAAAICSKSRQRDKLTTCKPVIRW